MATNSRRRLKTMEWQLSPKSSKLPRHQTYQDVLWLFRFYGTQGLQEREPEFFNALDALERAMASVSAPPEDFMPTASPRERQYQWEQARRPPAVMEALEWLLAMHEREIAGMAGVSTAEWFSLQQWCEQTWPLWEEDIDVMVHLDEHDMGITQFIAEVAEDNGRTLKTNELVPLLRRMKAATYLSSPQTIET